MELEFFCLATKKSVAFTHPLILAGILGQLSLITCIFWTKPKKWLLFGSLFLLGIIVLFFLLAGILSGKVKIIASTLPFWVITFLLIRKARKS